MLKESPMQPLVRIVRTLGAVAVAGSLAAAPGIAYAAPSPQAGAPIALPLQGFGGIEVTNKYVFIAGGKSADGIVVTNLNGGAVKKLKVGATAIDLALSRDRRTLYAVQRNVASIVAIDTTTLKETGRYATGTCPQTVAVTDRIWFGYSCGESKSGIGVIDLTGPVPAVRLGVHDGVEYRRAPVLDAPQRTNLLVAGVDRSLTTFTQQPDGALKQTAANEIGVTDLAVAPDASTVFVANGSSVRAYSVAEHTYEGVLATGDWPNAVAISRNGVRLAAGSSDSSREDVYVFQAKDPAPEPALELGDGLELMPRGLAWSDDGKRLYAISHSTTTPNAPALHVFKEQ
jgi:hypothetical protein